jgi:hypothetical protein
VIILDLLRKQKKIENRKKKEKFLQNHVKIQGIEQAIENFYATERSERKKIYGDCGNGTARLG